MPGPFFCATIADVDVRSLTTAPASTAAALRTRPRGLGGVAARGGVVAPSPSAGDVLSARGDGVTASMVPGARVRWYDHLREGYGRERQGTCREGQLFHGWSF